MLSIIFGYSKYYVDNLSENVKRGKRTKVETGWRPNQAPIGYLNEDRKSTRLTQVTNAHIVCRILLDNKKLTVIQPYHFILSTRNITRLDPRQSTPHILK